MTCQHCQTWVSDDEHRCQRCGRRVRSTPRRISPDRFPIAGAATAVAYGYAAEPDEVAGGQLEPGQQSLFHTTADPRVIPFDSLTSPAERASIRARAAETARPAPLKAAKVGVHHARSRTKRSADQRRLDFLGEEAILALPKSDIICDAPVAPTGLRTEAGAVDGLIMCLGCVVGLGIFSYAGGTVSFDKHSLPFLILVLAAVAFFYKALWVFAGRDSFGMQRAGLRLVDFDGNPPSQHKRYLRLCGSIVSLMAAGIGLFWAFVDEDGLTWHDHISSTFPTVASENTE